MIVVNTKVVLCEKVCGVRLSNFHTIKSLGHIVRIFADTEVLLCEKKLNFFT